MPYRSKSQQKKFHAMEERGEISAVEVHKWDEATKRQPGGFGALPERVKAKKGANRKRTKVKGKAKKGRKY